MLSNIFIQISTLLIKSVSLLILSQKSYLEVSQMEISFRFLTILGTIIGTLQPIMWPLISNAYLKRDFIWTKRVKHYFLLCSLIFSLLMLCLFYLYGESIFIFWLGEAIDFNSSLILYTTIYFVPISIAQVYIIHLFSLGRFNYVGKILIVESLVYCLILFILHLVENVSVENCLLVMMVLRLVASPFFIFKVGKEEDQLRAA